MKKWVFLVLLSLEIIVLPNIFLFTPQPNEWNFYRYENTWGFPVVIDAVGFIHPAIHLNELVNPREKRQSRPLYMVVGNGLGHLTAWATNNLYPSFIPSAKENCRKELFVSLTRLGDPFDTIAVFYLGFVMFNFLLLFIAAWIFADLIEIIQIPKTLALLIFAIFLVNDITKTFLWTVHQQMFTFLTPIFLIWWLVKYCILQKSSPAIFLATAAMGGIVFLIYGNLILLFPTLIYGHFITGNWTIKNLRWLPTVIGITVCFALPSFGWVMYVTQHAGYYYNYEISEFRQLVWPLDYVKNLGILKAGFICLVYTKNFLSTFLYRDILPFVVLIAALLAFRPFSIKKNEITAIGGKPTVISTMIFVFLLGFGFFCLLGYYRPRISFFLVIPILLYVAINLKSLWNQKVIKSIAVSLTSLWIAWHYISFGHYM